MPAGSRKDCWRVHARVNGAGCSVLSRRNVPRGREDSGETDGFRRKTSGAVGKTVGAIEKTNGAVGKTEAGFVFPHLLPFFQLSVSPRVAILSSPPAACFPRLLQEALHSVGAVFNSTFCISGIRIPKRLRQSSASRPAGSRISSRVRASTGSSCPRCRP